MAVDTANVIDGMGDRGDKLILLITDHLEWDDEHAHLQILQNKINAYASFVISKQYEENYPNKRFSCFVIEISFKYEIVEMCRIFLGVSASRLEEFAIKIEAKRDNRRFMY
ncbi:branched-chain amino acid ABC transporter substrate-binding protein [Listeria weihenstephanensis]|uniref:Branched-chain amino acid ABC transporter substrate-binding protein n=1 Tax=Listeria weihenstephanensis TaxID=1006155 RepID=A0A841Z3H7_9LIST|nr:DUF6572 domain-containing protein [Listeria weihenstephanensis]MBC1499830.1 branched-chain amino acid ABC transporter substrate-binding protein [Listeria weihenstephanensis]